MKSLNPFPEDNLSTSQDSGIITCQVTGQHPGRVYFRATYWPARLSTDINPTELHPGETVNVIGRAGLTLLVTPLPQQRE